MIKGNVRKIKAMALDLLNYAKEREPQWQVCDPNLPAEEVVDLMRSQAAERGVSLKTDLASDLPKTLLDPEGIHKVLLNLVTNAIDACTDLSCTNKRGEVTVRTSRRQDSAVQYHVIDNGCGMDEETRSKVFQRFFSTKGSQGTGLGLMIAKKIVDEHGGVIDLVSEKDKGTAVAVTLPQRDRASP
jgi:signal transduction histidine kinase